MSEGFQLGDQGPEAFEQYLVPTFFRPCAEHLLAAANLRRGERVLDVACGSGIVARLAAPLVGAEGAVTGLDVNDGMLAVAASVTEPDVIDWRHGDAHELPFAAENFDVVACQQGLQFFADQAGALREAHRVLRPGGRVVLAVWRPIDVHPVFQELTLAFERDVSDEAAAIMRAPFCGPSREELLELLTLTGFTEIVVTIGDLKARFPSAAEFVRQEVVSSPLAGPVGAIDDTQRDIFLDHFTMSVSAYLDDEGMVCPLSTWLATAGRP